MSPDPSPATTFAAVFAALLAAHHVADYWVQTDHQAVNKGRHGEPVEDAAGRTACAAHVTSYTATSTAAVVAANRTLPLGVGWRAVLAGQAVSAATHYWADRRYTLRGLAERVGKLPFYERGEGLARGSAALDQAWHVGWLGVAALVTAKAHRRPKGHQ
jgi:hypothetical protein